MIPIRVLLLTDDERRLLRGVTPYVVLAYPTHDAHHPERRALAALTQPHALITRPQAVLGLTVLTRMHTVLVEQANPDWWHRQAAPVPDRDQAEANETMAGVMAAERGGQVPHVVEAVALVAQMAGLLGLADDPDLWRQAEDGDLDPDEVYAQITAAASRTSPPT